ncbi:MAG: flagellar motor protein MotB [Alphaproteobacteria bacterium]
MSKDKQTIIIKKVKKGGHGGHHGGAWKVAYADFVTAMMAFFLLLWLLGSVPTEKLRGIADYFTPTIGLKDQMGIGFKGGLEDSENAGNKRAEKDKSILNGAPIQGPIVKMPDSSVKKLEELDAQNFSSIQKDLYKAIKSNPDLKEFSQNIVIDQTPEGLRIQILDLDKKPMFVPHTSILQPYTKKILSILAKYIRYIPNYLSINGHTSKDASDSQFDNWQLSSERSNETRKFFIDEAGLDREQIARIVGKADQEPYDTVNPYAVSNMRISLILLRNTIMPFQKQAAPEAAFNNTDVSKSEG